MRTRKSHSPSPRSLLDHDGSADCDDGAGPDERRLRAPLRHKTKSQTSNRSPYYSVGTPATVWHATHDRNIIIFALHNPSLSRVVTKSDHANYACGRPPRVCVSGHWSNRMYASAHAPSY